jgi:hypothetical protein
MHTTIRDFTDAEQKLVSAALFERYGKLVSFRSADRKLQLDASSEELTLNPRRSIGPNAVRNLSRAKPLPTAFAVNSSIPSRGILGQVMTNTTVWAALS